MYNLMVTGNGEGWSGEPWLIETSRCVREYTDTEITKQFGKLDATAVAELQRLPCIFAYEASCKQAPKFGIIRDITRRQDQVRIEYEIRDISPFLSADDLQSLAFDLDITKWELNRSHWAVKNVNVARELRKRGINLPGWARDITKAVDISTHLFDVALSFPGEVRPVVEQIAQELERLIGPNSYFYDNNYVSQLARPSLDTLLQDIYRNRSKLIVVFIGRHYQLKDWCGIEFRAIKEIIMERDHKKIMFVKMDDGSVDGVFKTDGYVDGQRFSPQEIARFVEERVALFS
ncbi:MULTISPECIES: toll/interleukin-1 receptor domain-containing protein [Achromobacter]|uniref:TIR domain-containing protein n=1 Tax=Achromobacter spanius TaxID=217203 RepID=A0ABY8GUS1_9BURK|nr:MULTISPECIES: TIR domain-containing protein [Achromobacter]WAI82279.1 TIR domain-containing protein [Achromobacter spanius]WEX92367.1 TIR domain-containing protein [Achromobacter sp. SS2-2022]WFP08482.1 TIR domain-containing protein [Achromobacter spanius]